MSIDIHCVCPGYSGVTIPSVCRFAYFSSYIFNLFSNFNYNLFYSASLFYVMNSCNATPYKRNYKNPNYTINNFLNLSHNFSPKVVV